MDCSVCGSSEGRIITDFGNVPLCDNFYIEKDRAVESPKFPIQIQLCKKCGHSELTVKPPEDLIYADYTYRTSLSPLLKEHFKEYANSISQICNELSCNSRTFEDQRKFLDIGGNDGVLASEMSELGYKSFIVDPSPTSKFCNEKINLTQDYFKEVTARRLIEEHGTFDIISCNNCIANIRDLHDIAKSISLALKENGLLFIETGYIHEQVKSKTAEMLNHEHYHYFSVRSMSKLFESYGIKLLKSSTINTKGGSFRFVGIKSNNANGADTLIEEEIRINEFNEYIKSRKKNLKDSIQGKDLAFFGSSAGSTILAYLFNLEDRITYLVDDNRTRHGFYMPGCGAEVISPENWYAKESDICINFAWRFGEMIRSKHLPNLPHEYRVIDIY